MSHLKSAAIGRAGHEYQDLVGIERLIDFYRNRRRYRWIELESEDEEMGYLDDIVVALSDGKFDLIQVKFTVDPTRYHLDWDWLLERKPRGTSLLAKWARSVNGFADPINIAGLETNRVPDPDFASTLDKTGRVNFDELEATRRAAVEAEMGGAYLARRFFARFQFFHSKPTLDEFEADLRSSIVPTDTDIVGWMTLRAQAKRWAMQKNAPEPDGRITHRHLTQIITKKAPRPMPQNFAVPAGYSVPSQVFHEAFLKRVQERSAITVLWGTPGRGKSTYLSFLSKQMREAQIPSIRHHYFLSLDDRTTDRFSFPDIARSLMHQMSNLYPDAVKGTGLEEEPGQLFKWLEACGSFFQRQGKIFLVVIDGLDHVWRERRNLDHLNHLFEHLIPCAENVGLIVGTQKISDDKLPPRLLRKLTKKDWLEIPAMDELSVQGWVRQQYVAKRLRLTSPRNPDQPIPRKLGAIGKAFFEISKGHPLHLIYSFEALVRTGEYVDAEAVRLLPPCPEGDINNYYRLLWAKLSRSAREIVHVIAGSDFHWPLDGIVRNFGQIDEVDFLLEHRRVGLVPFHGSILAFVRERPDHNPVFKALLPRVVKWLKKDAPPYWRWGWLWLIQSKNGDHSPLFRGPTRAWAIESVREGWPLTQLTTILKAAEQIAFETGDYARTIELRSLKLRVLNASEFQISNFDRAVECAMTASANVQMVDVLADSLSTLDDATVLSLCRVARSLKRDMCEEAKRELASRVDLWIRLRHRPDKDFIDLSKKFLEACALCEEIDTPELLRFIGKFTHPQDIFETFLDALSNERRVEVLASLYSLLDSKMEGWRAATIDRLIKAATFEQVDAIPILGSLVIKELSPFACCWMHYHKIAPAALVKKPTRPAESNNHDRQERQNQTAEYLYQLFFFELYEGIRHPDKTAIANHNTGEFIELVISLVTATARDIAAGRSELSFSTLYYAARQIDPVADRDYSNPSFSQYIGFRWALRRIAVDLHVLKQPTGNFRPISDHDLRRVRASKHWSEEDWLEDQIAQRIQILSFDQAAESLSNEVRHLSDQITSFNERGEKWVLLSRFASLYALPNLPILIGRALDCAFGYGWHKDVWMIDILESIADIHRSGATNGLRMLRQVVPIVDKITEFTDGDETDHVRSSLIQVVAQVSPTRMPNLYAHHLEADDFHYAEEALEEHLKIANPDSDITMSLARTFVDYRDVSILSKLDARSSKIRELLADQILFLGGTPPKPIEFRDSNSDVGRGGEAPDVTKFAPSAFSTLVKRIDKSLGYERHAEVLRNWLVHWERKGKARQALASIQTYFEEEDRTLTADRILDDAFLVSMRAEGKKPAYYWLVKAHIHRNGWQSYWTSESEIETRLKHAANFYKSDWQQFILDTSVPVRYWRRKGYGFVMGTKYLVRFLLMVGQNKLAIDFTRSCIRVVQAEVSDQPIPETPWFG